MAKKINRAGMALGFGMTGMTDPADLPRPSFGSDARPSGASMSGHDSAHWQSAGQYGQYAQVACVASPTDYTPVDDLTWEEIQDIHSQPFPDYQPLNELANLSPFASPPQQVSRKKRPSDAGLDISVRASGLDMNHGKRKKRKTNGYCCTYPNCFKVFNLECEATKHFKAAHTEGKKQCSHCKKRFHWDKDVKRHLKQVHNIEIAQVEYTTSSPDVQQPGQFEPENDDRTTPLPTQQPTSHRKPKKPRMSFSSVQKLVMMLNGLSLKAKDNEEQAGEPERPEKHVLVTQDEKTWLRVSLENAFTSEMMLQQIAAVFPTRPQRFLLHRYRSNHRGKRIASEDLVDAVETAAKKEQSLELVLTPVAKR